MGRAGAAFLRPALSEPQYLGHYRKYCPHPLRKALRMTSVADEAWFRDPALLRVLELLNHDGGEGRVVGGAVRNSLMGLPAGDVDIATTLLPEIVVGRAKAAGIQAGPTGIAHGHAQRVVDGPVFGGTKR